MVNSSLNVSGIEALFGNIFGTGGLFGGGDFVITGVIILLLFAIFAFHSSVGFDFIMPFFIVLMFGLSIYGFLPGWLGLLAAIGGTMMFGIGLINFILR